MAMQSLEVFMMRPWVIEKYKFARLGEVAALLARKAA